MVHWRHLALHAAQRQGACIQEDGLTIHIMSIKEHGNSRPVIHTVHNRHAGQRMWKSVVPTAGHPLACHQTTWSTVGWPAPGNSIQQPREYAWRVGGALPKVMRLEWLVHVPWGQAATHEPQPRP
jgi:hypothetical protein